MNKNLILALICYFSLANNLSIFSQCIKGNCNDGFGTFKFKSNDKYVGEWFDSKFNGRGKYYFANGSFEEGEWKNGIFEGYGTYFNIENSITFTGFWVNNILQDGQVEIIKNNEFKYEGGYRNKMYFGKGKLEFFEGIKYEGNFENNFYEGIGKLVLKSGDVYKGNFKNNAFEGNGEYKYLNGDKYIGQFLNGDFEGIGQYFYNNGDKYIGQFKKGNPDGNGKYILKNGTIIEGNWSNGKFYPMEESENNNNFGNKINSNSSISIKMKKNEYGQYEIPLKLNEALTLDFIIDTGASELSITFDVFMTLLRTKTITEDDILEGKQYLLADGSVTDKKGRVNIKMVSINGVNLYNIEASVHEKMTGQILLGQNLLTKLGKIQLDFNNNLFTIVK